MNHVSFTSPKGKMSIVILLLSARHVM
jgi:hypothetical protein